MVCGGSLGRMSPCDAGEDCVTMLRYRLRTEAVRRRKRRVSTAMNEKTVGNRRRPGRVVLVGMLALVLQAWFPSSSFPAVEPQLRRYPYLTDVVGSSATVNWATDRTVASGILTWGKAGVESCTTNQAADSRRTAITVNTVSEYQFQAQATALEPDTRYCYRVFAGGIDLLGSDP